jgi:hypothetical protein
MSGRERVIREKSRPLRWRSCARPRNRSTRGGVWYMQENLDVEWDAAAGALKPQSDGIRRGIWSCYEAYL